MAKNSKRLDKSKNYNKVNNGNQLVELGLDELEFVVGGKKIRENPDTWDWQPPPGGGSYGSQGSQVRPGQSNQQS